MRTSRIAAIAIAFAAAGCAHAPPTVLDADYGRLRPEQTSAVDSARSELSRGHEELAAARSKIGEARREEKLAEADREAAKREMERARKVMEAAEARSRAADARGAYAEKLTAAREAGAEAAQRRIDLAGAKVELLKLQALEQARMQPSKAYDDKEFYGAVADAQKKLDDARGNVRQLDDDATSAQRRWDELNRRVPVE